MKILLLALLGLILLAAVPASAQPQNPGMESPERTQRRLRALYERPAPPAALPGSRVGRGEVAPAERPSSEMSPNEALFDAVNRGDMASARDALTRGADIEQPNVLGLTALDLAVDLGRNDMTFLLLSMRGAAPGARSPLAPPAKPSAVTAARPAAPPRAVAEPAVVAPVARRARLAGDPGTPAPQAGFLGFGGGALQ